VKRLDVNDPKVFDKWRELYYDLTHEENIQFGYDMEAKYPGQASFDAPGIQAILSTVENKPNKVLEIGGWKGELAQCTCAQSPGDFLSWTNIDMCKAAVEKSVHVSSVPYRAHFPDRFDWFISPREEWFDVCISAHSIEHLTDKHLLQLMDWIKGIPVVIFEAPITNTGQTWDGYFGTHILEMGWTRLNQEMAARGYEATKHTDILYSYQLRTGA